MSFPLRLSLILPCAALLGSGCIIVDDTDDDEVATTVADTSGATTSEAGESATSDTSGGATSENTSGTSGADTGSSGLVVSGSSGAVADCSRCDSEVEPDLLCNSSYDAVNDVCACDKGHIFESDDPAGESNFACEPGEGEPPKEGCGSDPNNAVDEDGNCICVEGWAFCTDDLDDFSCCEV